MRPSRLAQRFLAEPDVDLEEMHRLGVLIRSLIRSGQVDPLEGLAHVVWPAPEALAQFERRLASGTRSDQAARAAFSPAVKAEVRRLRDELGLSYELIGRRVGVSKATCVDWCREKSRAKDLAASPARQSSPNSRSAQSGQ